MTDWTIDKVRVYPQRAIDEIERLRGVLDFYADQSSYEYCAHIEDGVIVVSAPIITDEGGKARAVLSENAEA